MAQSGIPDASGSTAEAATLAIDTGIPFTQFLAQAERAYLRHLLEATPDGNMQVAAKAAGLEYETFRRRVAKCRLRVVRSVRVIDA